jgi:glycosyltransferase involved in cell wall biosynthesis
MNAGAVAFDIVIPTIGRDSLTTLLRALDRQGGRLPERLLLVDDRAAPSSSLPIPPLSPGLRSRVEVVRSGGNGPAAARNAGWRAGTAPWIAFLDDDVVPDEGWLSGLDRDLRSAAPDVAGSQGSLTVPLPADRAPTDWERNVAWLEVGTWITADMAYRRGALEEAGGFDERFRRAYREDTDLALRVQALGWRLMRGRRAVLHPVRPADALVSLRMQRGNADDVLMRALHPGYREGRVTLGKRPWHAATVAAFAGGAAAIVVGAPVVAGTMLVVWAGLTGALAWRRIAPGPRTAREIAAMMVTTIAMPFVACAWWIVGILRLPRLLADAERAPRPVVRAAPASSLEAAS